MKVKILFSLVTVVGLWWFYLRADRPAVPTLQVKTIATPTVSPTPLASLPTPQQQGTPSKLPSPTAVNQLAPIPKVANVPLASQPGVSPLPTVSTVVLEPRPLAIDPLTNQLLNALMSAVISQESSGNHQLEHPISKATGLGQVLPANIPQWTRETFGQELTVEQFRNSPDAQMYVIRQKLFQYYANAIKESNGDLYLAVRRVGAQWYSGQADLYDSTKPVATGPNIRDYTLQVLSRFRNFYPQNYLVRY